MSQTVISTSSGSRAILAGSGFRRLLAVRLTSQISDGWFQAGLAGSILFNPNQKSSPIEIAIGFAILLLPYSVLGPYVGVLLDRWDRRASLSAANLIRALFVIPTAIFLWNDRQDLWFAGSALVVIALNRFFLSGLSAALPRVVEDAKLVPGNALASTFGTVSYSIGLFSAAALISFNLIGIGTHAYGVIASIAALGYVTSGTLTRVLFKYEDLGPLQHEKHTGHLSRALVEVAQGMVAGAKHLWQRPIAARAMGLQAGYRVLYGVLTLATLLLFSRYFGQESTRATQSLRDLGFIVMAGAAGAAAAAVITPPAVRRFGPNRWLVSLVSSVGGVVLICGLPFDKMLLLLATFLINVASQSMKIIVDATIQHECEDTYRGRIFSVNDTLYNLCFVGGLFITATVFPDNGKSVAGLISVAVAFVGIACLFAITARRPSAAIPALPPPG